MSITKPICAIPEVIDDDGTRVRIICGEFWGKRGPVEGVAADPNYLDISVAPGEIDRAAVAHQERFRAHCRQRQSCPRRHEVFGDVAPCDDGA